jgi:very-short-patch-repair endonuclease
MKHSSPFTYARAKRMRSEMTEAERRMWTQLRGKRLNGLKFYRQAPIGPYIVDFISHAYGLVIEIDGPSHGEAPEVAHDAARTAYLEGLGLAVYRVPNIEVLTNMNGVLDSLLLAIDKRGESQERRWLPRR